MTNQEIAEAFGNICACTGASVADIRIVGAALERARVVGVLDAWAETVSGYVWHSGYWGKPDGSGGEAYCCELRRGSRNTEYWDDSADAARAAAAKAIEAGEI